MSDKRRIQKGERGRLGGQNKPPLPRLLGDPHTLKKGKNVRANAMHFSCQQRSMVEHLCVNLKVSGSILRPIMRRVQ